MDEKSILIADKILSTMQVGRVYDAVIAGYFKNGELKPSKSDLTFVIKRLIDEGFIINHSSGTGYELTSKGMECQRKQNKNCFKEYLSEKGKKHTKILEKEDADWEHKLLQIKELYEKMNTMNPKQIRFWSWNTWFTIIGAILSLGAIIVSIFALIHQK